MSTTYVYPGSKSEFYSEFGGLPDKSIGLANVFVITIIVILIIVAVTTLIFFSQRTRTNFVDHTGFYNLQLLTDINNANTECCVRPGTSTADQEYVYDMINDITYSRQIPNNINTVCGSFIDFNTCVSENTDSQGNIIPRVVFNASPYYTFEKGLFIGCSSTIPC